jgi:hypothetical protein
MSKTDTLPVELAPSATKAALGSACCTSATKAALGSACLLYLEEPFAVDLFAGPGALDKLSPPS